MHRNKTLIAAIVIALFAPVQALAESPNYSYANLTYVDDYFDSGLDGFSVNGSYAFNERFHFVGGYSRASGFGFSIDIIEAGAGYSYALTGMTDLVGRAGLVRASNGISDTSFFVEGGVRAMLTPEFELNGFVKQYVDDVIDETTFTVGAVYSFTERFGITTSVNNDSDLTLGVRFSF